MHKSPGVVLGCVDCHGGAAELQTDGTAAEQGRPPVLSRPPSGPARPGHLPPPSDWRATWEVVTGKAVKATDAEIAANPPLSLRKIKEGLSHPLKDDPEAFGSWIMETLNFLFTTEDHKEGVASFIEKRAAEFHGALPARL